MHPHPISAFLTDGLVVELQNLKRCVQDVLCGKTITSYLVFAGNQVLLPRGHHFWKSSCLYVALSNTAGCIQYIGVAKTLAGRFNKSPNTIFNNHHRLDSILVNCPDLVLVGYKLNEREKISTESHLITKFRPRLNIGHNPDIIKRNQSDRENKILRKITTEPGITRSSVKRGMSDVYASKALAKLEAEGKIRCEELTRPNTRSSIFEYYLV